MSSRANVAAEVGYRSAVHRDAAHRRRLGGAATLAASVALLITGVGPAGCLATTGTATQKQRVRISSSTPATLRVDGRVIGATPQTVELQLARTRRSPASRQRLEIGLASLGGSAMLGALAAFSFAIQGSSWLSVDLWDPDPSYDKNEGTSTLGVLSLVGVAVALVAAIASLAGVRPPRRPTATRFALAVQPVGKTKWHEVTLHADGATNALLRLHFDAKSQRWQTSGAPRRWTLLQMRETAVSEGAKTERPRSNRPAKHCWHGTWLCSPTRQRGPMLEGGPPQKRQLGRPRGRRSQRSDH